MVEVLTSAISVIDNVAIIILLLVSAGLGYAHFVWRKEERQDRRDLQRIVSDNTQAVADLRNMLTILVSQSGNAHMIPRDRRDYRDYQEDQFEDEMPTVTRRGRRG